MASFVSSKRWRFGLITLVGLTFVACVLTASSAYAEFTLSGTECTSSLPTYCYEGELSKSFALKGEEQALGSLVLGTEALLTARFGESEVHIVCTSVVLRGILLQPEPLIEPAKIHGLTLAYSGCALLEPFAKKCSIPTELKTKELIGTFNKETPLSTLTLSPSAGTVWMGVEFKNVGTEVCPATVRGTKNIAGTQTCTAIESEVNMTEHELSCEPPGSKLTLGENALEFLLDGLVYLEHLTTEKWSISTNATSFAMTGSECTFGTLLTICYETGTGALDAFEGKEVPQIELAPGTEALIVAFSGEFHIACPEVASQGLLAQGVPLVDALGIEGLIVVFKGCVVLAPLQKCAVAASLITRELAVNLGVSTALFKPSGGTTFIEFELANNGGETCNAGYVKHVKIDGTQTCEIVEPAVDLSQRRLVCLPGGSELTIGGEYVAEFLLEAIVKLAHRPKEPWAVESD